MVSPCEYELSDTSQLPDVEVAIEANILSVNDFDDSFKVAMLIHCVFKDPSVQKDNAISNRFLSAKSYHGFVPDITIINTISSQTLGYKKLFKVNEASGEVWVSLLNTFTIGENLEFSKFPFDRQLFRIQLTSENSKLGPWKHDPSLLHFGKVINEISTDAESASFLVTGSFKQWGITGITVSYNPAAVENVSLNEPALTLNVKAERKPAFYFFNYVFIVYVIGASNVVLLSVDPDTNFARNGVTLTLLLAMVSFKYVILKDTPRVNYVTYFDLYIRLGFGLLIVAFLVNILFSTRFLCHTLGLTSEDGCNQDTLFRDFQIDVDLFDFWVQIGIWIVWSLMHLAIFIVVMKPALIMRSWKTLYKGQKRLVSTPFHLSKFVYNEITKQVEKVGKKSVKPSRKKHEVKPHEAPGIEANDDVVNDSEKM